MKAWQERILVEYKELKDRLQNLDTFINSSKIDILKKEDKILLIRQYQCMKGYAEILELRIKNFEEK